MVDESNITGVLEDKLESYYSDAAYRNYRSILNEAIYEYNGFAFKNILDIGAGVGTLYDAIKPFQFDYYGLEVSEYGYDKLKEKGVNVKKFLLDGKNKLPFPDGFFSCVIFNQVIEHVEKHIGVHCLKEIVRVLEPGGVAVIKSPSRYARIFATDPHHIYCWRPNELCEEVNKFIEDVESIKMSRVPLEPWMFYKYSDEKIDTWHKYNKHPSQRRFYYVFFKILDMLANKVFGTDIFLAVSNVTFVKK